MSTDSRSYVVGLPVVVTVSPEGFVSVEVDLGDLTSAMSEPDSQLGEYSRETAERDTLTASLWSQQHTVKNEGFAE